MSTRKRRSEYDDRGPQLPPLKKKKEPIDWDTEPLGEYSDSAFARIFETTADIARRRRIERYLHYYVKSRRLAALPAGLFDDV